MSDAEIEKAVREAEQYAAEDKAKKDALDLKNEADALCYNIDTFIKENGDKITTEQKETLESKVSALRAATETEDIRNRKQDLEEYMHTISSNLYGNAQQQQ